MGGRCLRTPRDDFHSQLPLFTIDHSLGGGERKNIPFRRTDQNKIHCTLVHQHPTKL